ncbi:peptidoglycan bridge formation glycyltransferase FemA/FemB family protein [Candidatus Saccharibacteria bacterium]|nr:peptidoglycan bridge formation glycyltransferase FemA/FemB family protein [Candidatus Saccharibacteria bacterium]
MKKTDWQKLLDKHPEGNFLQSETWAEANSLMGRRFTMAVIDGTGLVSMIVRDAKRGRFLQVAGGPLIDWTNKKQIEKALEKIKDYAKEEKCIFARIRPQLRKTPENLTLLKSLGLKVAPMHLAAENTVILDLEKTEDELLAGMRRQTRYEVRRSQKLDLVVEKSNSEEIFREFHKVQAETAKRQNFIPPSLDDLLAERSAFLKMGDYIQIYVVKTGKNTEFKGEKYEAGLPIAYGLVFAHGNEAEYFEAASTDLNHVLPGAYALQWQIIKDLKALGIKRYNLWGIAPPNSPHHRYAGVTTFKTGFGGEVVEYVPAHDLIINKPKYLPNLIIENVRKKKRHL